MQCLYIEIDNYLFNNSLQLMHEMELRLGTSLEQVMSTNLELMAPQMIEMAGSGPFRTRLAQLRNEILEEETKKGK